MLSSIVRTGDWDGDGADDVVARITVTGELRLYPGNGRGGFLPPRRIGTGCSGIPAILGLGDLNGDARADLLARFTDGTLWLYPGNGRGGFSGVVKIGTGWGSFASISGSGDVNDDGRADLLAWSAAGRMILYPGNGRGGFLRPLTVGGGWTGYDFRG